MNTRPGRASRRRGIARAAGVAAACLPLLDCLAQSPAAPGPAAARAAPTAAQQIVEVIIRDYKFGPAELKIKVGTAVKWTNVEKRTSHSVLFTGEDGTESERLFPGESWQRTFDRPGLYSYTCGPHPEMSGEIEVSE